MHTECCEQKEKLEADSKGVKKKDYGNKKDSVTGLEGKTIVLEQSKE